MNKWQSQQQFWESFGLPAYDENTYFTKGERPAYPHITYQAISGVMGQIASVSASIWYKATSWADISQKADYILKQVSGGRVVRVEGGFFWFKVPELTPFAQRVDSGDEQIKRILISMEVESLTAD